MKKLIAFSYLLLVATLCVVSANAMPLFLANPWLNFSVLGNAVDVAAITAFADEHKRDIINTLVNDLDIAKDITVIPNVKNSVPLTRLLVNDGVRPYSTTHEPRPNALNFTDRTLTTRTGKRDMRIDYRAFKATHLAWRTRPGNAANKDFNDMDFAPYVWMKVAEGVKRELNDQTAYFGFDRLTGVTAYSAATVYTAGNRVTFTGTSGVQEWFEATATTVAGESPDTTPAKWLNVSARAVAPGLKTFIDAAIAASFPVTATGAVTNAATALAANQLLFRSFTPAYKNNGVIIHGSYTDYEFLLDALANRTQYISADTKELLSMGLLPVPETGGKCFFKPATWLGTSRRLIAEPIILENGNAYGANLVMGTDLLSDATDIEVIKDVYALNVGMSFDIGFQIQDLAALRLGNQA